MKQIKLDSKHCETGFVLLTCLMLIVVLSSLLAAYSLMSMTEFGTVRATNNSMDGFNAAESGLNLRTENIRAIFASYGGNPSGTSPSPSNACTGTNTGTQDFQCQTEIFGGIPVTTYMTQDSKNSLYPLPIYEVPSGEPFGGLKGHVRTYTVNSLAKDSSGNVLAELQLEFKSVLIPVFQFAAFYNKDFEAQPGLDMTWNGRIHANGDIYIDGESAGVNLAFTGDMSASKDLFRGYKRSNECIGSNVSVNAATMPCLGGSGRSLYNAADLSPTWSSTVHTNILPLQVPPVSSMAPLQGSTYWDKADLRLVVRLNNSNNIIDPTNSVSIVNRDGTVDAIRTAALTACPGSIGGSAARHTTSHYNFREQSQIQLLDVDMQALLNCIQNNNLLLHTNNSGMTTTVALDDTTEDGLVFYFTVIGPNSNTNPSFYGMRVRNGAELKSTVAGAPTIKGLTIVSDQAGYIFGDYNSTNKKPAAFLVDTLNILSNTWPANDYPASSSDPSSRPTSSQTYINAAFLAATTTTGGADGLGGRDKGNFNGGANNFPRFLEDWETTLTLRTSFISLNIPLKSNSLWQIPAAYWCPVRDWAFDTDFLDGPKLPPLTPRVVYLKQTLFARNYQ